MGLETSQFWLTDVKYLEGKRAIAMQFSQGNARRMLSMAFFPCFFVSKKLVGFEVLRKLLSREMKRFKAEPAGNRFRVSAGSLSGLNRLANTLFRETGCRPIVLSPERQFLLEKNWSYFDCFAFFSEKEFVKQQQFSVPEAKLGFFSEPLHLTLEQLAECDPGLAENLLESIVASNALRLPLELLPGSRPGQLETALLNMIWERGLEEQDRASLIKEAKACLDKVRQLSRELLEKQATVLAASQNQGKAVAF